MQHHKDSSVDGPFTEGAFGLTLAYAVGGFLVAMVAAQLLLAWQSV